MNRKISGAKLVLVPIKNLGQNYFPFVEDLKSRYIKYIDLHLSQYLPGTQDPGLTGIGLGQGNLFLSLANEIGNKLLFNEAPLEMFSYIDTKGVRQPIGAKLSLQNCYITCMDASLIGTTCAFVFYYDLPEFSARNKTDKLIWDSCSVPITTDTLYNKLPDVERMSGKRFRHVQFSPAQYTPEGATGVSANYDRLYLTLRKGSYNVIENVPLSILYQVLNLEKIEFANIVFDFQSSYIMVGGAGLVSFIGESAFLNFAYEM